MVPKSLRRLPLARLFKHSAVLGVLIVLTSGCASRVVEVETPPPPAAPSKLANMQDPAVRQGAGLGSGAYDDPAKRIGPNGQPAPYGRDTVTGRPISELNSKSTPAVAIPHQQSGSQVIVAQGDTLSVIAKRHKVSIDALMKANGLSSPVIQVGQALVLPRG